MTETELMTVIDKYAAVSHGIQSKDYLDEDDAWKLVLEAVYAYAWAKLLRALQERS